MKVRISLAAFVMAVMWQVVGLSAAFSGSLLQVEGRLLKWEPQTSTNSTVITYSILTAPYLVPGNKSILSPSNCAAMHAFSDIVAQSPKLLSVPNCPRPIFQQQQWISPPRQKRNQLPRTALMRAKRMSAIT